MRAQTSSIIDRPYATNDNEANCKPVYRVGNEPLPLSRNPHMAACDLMILTYAAQRHAKWLCQIGACPSGVAGQIRRNLALIEEAIAADGDASPQSHDVGPRAPGALRGGDATPAAQNATRRNTAKRGRTTDSLFNRQSHAGDEACADGDQNAPPKMYPRLANAREAGE